VLVAAAEAAAGLISEREGVRVQVNDEAGEAKEATEASESTEAGETKEEAAASAEDEEVVKIDPATLMKTHASNRLKLSSHVVDGAVGDPLQVFVHVRCRRRDEGEDAEAGAVDAGEGYFRDRVDTMVIMSHDPKQAADDEEEEEEYQCSGEVPVSIRVQIHSTDYTGQEAHLVADTTSEVILSGKNNYSRVIKFLKADYLDEDGRVPTYIKATVFAIDQDSIAVVDDEADEADLGNGVVMSTSAYNSHYRHSRTSDDGATATENDRQNNGNATDAYPIHVDADVATSTDTGYMRLPSLSLMASRTTIYTTRRGENALLDVVRERGLRTGTIVDDEDDDDNDDNIDEDSINLKHPSCTAVRINFINPLSISLRNVQLTISGDNLGFSERVIPIHDISPLSTMEHVHSWCAEDEEEVVEETIEVNTAPGTVRVRGFDSLSNTDSAPPAINPSANFSSSIPTNTTYTRIRNVAVRGRHLLTATLTSDQLDPIVGYTEIWVDREIGDGSERRARETEDPVARDAREAESEEEKPVETVRGPSANIRVNMMVWDGEISAYRNVL